MDKVLVKEDVDRILVKDVDMADQLHIRLNVAGLNLSSSICLFSLMSLLKYFCIDAESDVDDLTNIQLIELAFGNPSISATLLNFSNSLEIPLITLPSGSSLILTTILLAPNIFCCLVVSSVFR